MAYLNAPSSSCTTIPWDCNTYYLWAGEWQGDVLRLGEEEERKKTTGTLFSCFFCLCFQKFLTPFITLHPYPLLPKLHPFPKSGRHKKEDALPLAQSVLSSHANCVTHHVALFPLLSEETHKAWHSVSCAQLASICRNLALLCGQAFPSRPLSRIFTIKSSSEM